MSLHVDGFATLAHHIPTSVAELGDLIRQAKSQGHAVYPIGGQTMLAVGLPPTKPGVAIDTTKLSQVIDYPARDMTITVQAGIRMSKLQAILSHEQQELPIDIPHPSQATLGGSLAVNVSGPRRFGQGTLRDAVIGISAVNDQGEEYKAGGRVVKNVAGYDMMKLLIGSLGTLGIITQVTLKVKPKAGAYQSISFACPLTDCQAVLTVCGTTRTRPSTLILMLEQDVATFTIGLEDNPASVAWQMAQLTNELPASVRPAIIPTPALPALTDFPLQSQFPITYKANVLPVKTWAFLQQVRQYGHTQALFGNGIIFGHLTDVSALSAIQRAAIANGGNTVLWRCPPELKTLERVWGVAPPDLAMMRAIKQQFDPELLFNPGRFVGGI